MRGSSGGSNTLLPTENCLENNPKLLKEDNTQHYLFRVRAKQLRDRLSSMRVL